MTIITNTFIPYDFDNKRKCLEYVESRSHGLKNSMRLIEKDTEHLTIRCPVSGDYLDIVGTTSELEWLHNELTIRNLYRTK